MSHVPLLAAWNPKMGFWGPAQERAYNLNDNVSRGFYSMLIHKNNILLRLEVTVNR